MTFAAVGSLVQFQNVGSFSLTPGAVGDLILVEVVSQTAAVTGLSSSNVTWSAMGSEFTGTSVGVSLFCTVWAGKVTSTSAATVTVSGGNSAHQDIVGFEYSTTVGGWALDAQGNLDSATNAYPTLTPTHGAGELYFGYSVNSASASAGATTGYTYAIDSASNGLCYDVNCANSAQSPTWGAGDTAAKTGIAVLVYEASGSSALRTATGRSVTGRKARKGTTQGSPQPLRHIEEVVQPLGTLVRGRPGKKGRAQGSPAPLLHIEEVIPATGATVRGKPGRKGSSKGSPLPLVPPPVPSVQPPAATGKTITGRKGRKGASAGSPRPLVHIEDVPAVPSGATVRGKPGRRGSSAGSKPIPVSFTPIPNQPAATGATIKGKPGRKGSSAGSKAPQPSPLHIAVAAVGKTITGRRGRRGTAQGSSRPYVHASGVVAPQQGTVTITATLAGTATITAKLAGTVAISDTLAGTARITSSLAGTVTIRSNLAGTVTIVSEL